MISLSQIKMRKWNCKLCQTFTSSHKKVNTPTLEIIMIVLFNTTRINIHTAILAWMLIIGVIIDLERPKVTLRLILQTDGLNNFRHTENSRLGLAKGMTVMVPILHRDAKQTIVYLLCQNVKFVLVGMVDRVLIRVLGPRRGWMWIRSQIYLPSNQQHCGYPPRKSVMPKIRLNKGITMHCILRARLQF